MRKNYFSKIGTFSKPFNKVRQFSSFLAVLLLLVSGRMSAQIATYTNSTTGALNSVAANATGTPLARINGVTAPGSPCSTGFSSTNFTSTTTYLSTLGAVEVTVTPASGFQLNVTGFSAGLRRSGTGPASVRLAYQIGTGAVVDQGSNQAPNNAGCGSTTTATWTTSFIANQVVKFRIYGFNASGTGGTFQVLNLNINGTVTSGTVTVPSVTTNAATSIASTTATFNASVNPNGASTTASFDYGTATGVYPNNVVAVQSPVITTTSITAAPTLSVNTQYFYRATATNSAGTTNGSEVNFWTLANVPSAPTVSAPTLNSLDVALNVNGNPASTQFAIRETSTGNYVQASGILGVSAVWQTAAVWSTVTVTGLNSATTYSFVSKARNGVNVETAFSGSANGTTLSSCASPSSIIVSNESCSTADVSWTAATGTILGYEYAVTTSATPPASGTFTASASASLTGLAATTAYNVFVRTQCSGSSFSTWVGPVAFNTASGAFAGTLAIWDPTGLTAFGPSPFAATTVAGDVVAGGLVRGAGVVTTGTAALNAWGGSNWTGNANEDATFKIEPDNGAFLSLDTLKLRYRHSGTGPTSGDLEYSIDGGSTFNLITTLLFPSTSSSGASITPVVLDAIVDLQNVQSPTQILFRIHPLGGASTGTFYVYNTSSEPGLRLIGSTSPFAAAISGAATICSGQDTVITITGLPADAYVTYSINGVPADVTLVGGIAEIPTGTLTADATFELISIAFNSTSSCSQLVSGSVTVTVIEAPVITVQPVGTSVCAGDPFTLSVTATDASSYQWFLDGSAVTGETSSSINVPFATSLEAGNYTVVVYGNSPCGNDTSDVAVVAVLDCRKGSFADNAVLGSSELKVYPNPADGLLNIELPAGEITSVELYNLQGFKVAGEKVNNSTFMQWNIMDKCENGSYLLKVQTEGKTFQKLVIKGK